jgi:hypothetical protein
MTVANPFPQHTLPRIAPFKQFTGAQWAAESPERTPYWRCSLPFRSAGFSGLSRRLRRLRDILVMRVRSHGPHPPRRVFFWRKHTGGSLLRAAHRRRDQPMRFGAAESGLGRANFVKFQSWREDLVSARRRRQQRATVTPRYFGRPSRHRSPIFKMFAHAGAYRGGLSASGPVELFRVNGFAFAALCGPTSNLYPTLCTESMNRGAFGSGSILRRRRATSISTLRS